MNRKPKLFVVLMGSLLLSPALLLAKQDQDSVADAARKAQADKKTSAKPAMVFTNDNLDSIKGQISIADSGPGIPQESLTKIFMPFYTTKANGTGLGLAVVQKIVVQHGGTIEARNQQQGGAEFIVWLPFVREPVRSIDSAPARI